MPRKYSKQILLLRDLLALASRNYFKIKGPQLAAAFAYYAFFSLLPLVLLTSMIALFFGNRDHAAREVIGYFNHYAPLSSEINQDIFNTIRGVADSHGGVMVLIPLMFFWGAFRFFNVLLIALNRAWGIRVKSEWRLPLKNLALLGITGMTILLGLAVPVMARVARNWLLSTYDFVVWTFDAGVTILPLFVLFWGLSLLYRLAPCQTTRFSQVWSPALAVAALLCGLENLFVIYLRNFDKFNLVYGAFGGMMALLLWIYLSGCLIVLGACLCAAQAQVTSPWWGRLRPKN